ncbi:hypothetical protein [Inediibacterium massiliense]|uniref:hypothetical protein n=1 Tax=Inediibacterium massiliense TaxID=1658111 RepID=UPI0006B634E4|nr:hypothetical protein [Inediibacterium massiliense]
MKKTFSIKLINFILWTKLIILSSIFLLSCLAYMLDTESELVKRMCLLRPEFVAVFQGYIFFHIILVISTLRSIAKRSYKWICWLLGLQLVTHLKNPIMSVLFIILLCTVLFGEKTKAYLKYPQACIDVNPIE